jgi:hypothetical protein
MPRPKRIAEGNIVYHVLDRASGRLAMFKTPAGFCRPPGQEKWILKTAADYPSAWNIADVGKTEKRSRYMMFKERCLTPFFRAVGRVELWNADTGETKPVDLKIMTPPGLLFVCVYSRTRAAFWWFRSD